MKLSSLLVDQLTTYVKEFSEDTDKYTCDGQVLEEVIMKYSTNFWVVNPSMMNLLADITRGLFDLVYALRGYKVSCTQYATGELTGRVIFSHKKPCVQILRPSDGQFAYASLSKIFNERSETIYG